MCACVRGCACLHELWVSVCVCVCAHWSSVLVSPSPPREATLTAAFGAPGKNSCCLAQGHTQCEAGLSKEEFTRKLAAFCFARDGASAHTVEDAFSSAIEFCAFAWRPLHSNGRWRSASSSSVP